MRRVGLIVLDGWGLREARENNAVALARTPVFDTLWEKYPHAEMAASGALHDVCAEQWRRCVEDAADALEAIPAERVLRLRYEEVTRDPGKAVEQLADFLGVPAPDLGNHEAFVGISDGSIGKSARSLDAGARAAVLERIRPTLRSLGYDETP